MKNEVSDTVMMAVTVTMISIVVGIIAFTIYLGKDIGGIGINMMDKIIDDVNTGTLNELSGEVREMPTASIYSIMEGIGSKSIDKATSSNVVVRINKGVYQYLPLMDNITGKVLVETYKLPTGLYRIIIHNNTCSIGDGGGNCNCTAEAVLRARVLSDGLKW